MTPPVELPILIPTSAMPPEARPFLAAVVVVGVLWWIGRHLWSMLANRPADRIPRVVTWYERRGQRSKSSIVMGGAIALIGLAILLMFSEGANATPNSLLGLAIFAIGFAQFLYGTLVLR